MSLNQDIKSFDIHQKLRTSPRTWSYMHSVGAHQADANYEFCTNFIDEIEYALYKRIDSYFVLVDFFKSYDEACSEAKDIIINSTELKKLFSIDQ